MIKEYIVDYYSPIGVIEIIGTDKAISSILFTEREFPVNRVNEKTPEVLKECCKQLDEYFNGERLVFSFPYLIDGTEFQRNVWNELIAVPYAKTKSYKDMAILIGNVKAVRAVGKANGKNKLSIVIPCHRIIGSNGELIGYAGGLWRKEWLLDHEQSVVSYSTEL
ncbi:methylated-DNA--[protein]-cysteine S-methyltransferase [Bacillus spongiae]|uniref:Methylated-DNA--protein-cysteine methyltransferase n=1 Tax=Bacillus spongiae TaxID=2683610 RepID=A0ABU8HFC4_9BACI